MATPIKQYAFKASDNKAKVAEARVQQLLEAHGNNVINVRSDPKYQKMDVDLLVTTSAGVLVTTEVKSDNCYKNGNFCLETISNDKKNTPGWALYTSAAMVVIYFPQVDRAFLLDGPGLVEWMKKNYRNYPIMNNATPDSYGNELYQSECRIIPRQVLEENENIFIGAFDVGAFIAKMAVAS